MGRMVTRGSSVGCLVSVRESSRPGGLAAAVVGNGPFTELFFVIKGRGVGCREGLTLTGRLGGGLRRGCPKVDENMFVGAGSSKGKICGRSLSDRSVLLRFKKMRGGGARLSRSVRTFTRVFDRCC